MFVSQEGTFDAFLDSLLCTITTVFSILTAERRGSMRRREPGARAEGRVKSLREPEGPLLHLTASQQSHPHDLIFRLEFRFY